MPDTPLEQARARLGSARRVLVLAGAGLSQEAGLPTFRDEGGLWRQHRPEELASPEAFARDPRLVWEWYRMRMEAARQAVPHAGHLALATLARREGLDVLVVNQNVDGLLERAFALREAPVEKVLAIHGTLSRAHCQRCAFSVDSGDLPPQEVPVCACGGLLRPSVVWFGETLRSAHLRRMSRAAEVADVLLVVGTSAQVWPAAGLVPLVKSRGVPVVVVNPDAAAGQGDLLLRGGALELLPALVEEV